MIGELGVEGELVFHTDPCHRVYCAMCDLDDCPVRREPFARTAGPHAGGGGAARHATVMADRPLAPGEEREPARRLGGYSLMTVAVRLSFALLPLEGAAAL